MSLVADTARDSGELRRASSSSSSSSSRRPTMSCCSDMREINEAKVTQILSYLQDTLSHVDGVDLLSHSMQANKGSSSYDSAVGESCTDAGTLAMLDQNETGAHNDATRLAHTVSSTAKLTVSALQHATVEADAHEQGASTGCATANAAVTRISNARDDESSQQPLHPLASLQNNCRATRATATTTITTTTMHHTNQFKPGAPLPCSFSVLSSSGCCSAPPAPSHAASDVELVGHANNKDERGNKENGNAWTALRSVTLSHATKLSASSAASSSVAAASTAEGAVSCRRHRGGIEQAQNTYFQIRHKIDALRFENDALQRDKAALREQLQLCHTHEEQRHRERESGLRAELRDCQAALTDARRAIDAEVAAWKGAHAEQERRCEQLVAQHRSAAMGWAHEREQLVLAHKTELGQLRSRWQAHQRTGQERWRAAEAQRIKATTLQSLEPDIVLLLQRHKADKARMKDEYEAELRQRDEALAAKDAAEAELRARLQRSTADVLAREQRLLDERLSEELSRLRRTREQEQQREQEKRVSLERHYEGELRELRQRVHTLGEELTRCRGEEANRRADFQAAVEQEVRRVTRRSEEEMTSLREKLQAEARQRELAQAVQNAAHLQRQEEELRRRCELTRDAEVAKVVQRLEQEHLTLLQSARHRDVAVRERYEGCARDHERTTVELDLARTQLQSALAARKASEEELAQLRKQAALSRECVCALEQRTRSEYEGKMTILDSEWQTRTNERESQHVREVQAVQSRLEDAQREAQRVREACRHEQQTMEQKHHLELSQITERVLVAMTKKENTIQMLNEQMVSLQEAIQIRDRELQRHVKLLDS